MVSCVVVWVLNSLVGFVVLPVGFAGWWLCGFVCVLGMCGSWYLISDGCFGVVLGFVWRLCGFVVLVWGWWVSIWCLDCAWCLGCGADAFDVWC